jgi:hypothetical protein
MLPREFEPRAQGFERDPESPCSVRFGSLGQVNLFNRLPTFGTEQGDGCSHSSFGLFSRHCLPRLIPGDELWRDSLFGCVERGVAAQLPASKQVNQASASNALGQSGRDLLLAKSAQAQADFVEQILAESRAGYTPDPRLHSIQVGSDAHGRRA